MKDAFMDYARAVAYHDEHGGILLNLGEIPYETYVPGRHPRPVGGNHRPGSGPLKVVWRVAYVVVSKEDAIDFGRTPEQIDALAPGYREPE